MNSSFDRALALFASLALMGSAHADDGRDPLKITIHHHDGFSAASSPAPKLVLFKAHTHFHLKLTNLTDRAIELWKPGCPEGDRAFRVEFRTTGDPAIYQSVTLRDYTGGSGVPKTHSLAAGDDVIVNVNLLEGGGWSFPLTLAKREARDVEVRAVYQPEPFRKDVHGIYERLKLKLAWEGKVTSPWEKIRIVNRTGKAFGPSPAAIAVDAPAAD